MQKRVFLLHGWDGAPTHGWLPWLKSELESADFTVEVPQLPQPQEPRIANWVPALSGLVGTPDKETYFVGHSLGCPTILRYLAELPVDVVFGGAVFVAGVATSFSNMPDNPLTKSVTQEWLDTPLDLSKVRPHLPRSIAIFSDDDPYVPLENQIAYRDMLGSQIMIAHHQGHFSTNADLLQLPIVRDALLQIAL